MAGRTRLIDRGWIGRRRRVSELKRITVLVGVQADAGAGEDGVPIAEYAAYNELGTEHIPSRPAIRNAFDNNLAEISDSVRTLREAVEDGKIGAEEAAGLLGELHQGHIQRSIRSNTPPPLAPATVKAKGSSRSLVDQGDYASSIRWKIQKRAGGLRGMVASIFGGRA